MILICNDNWISYEHEWDIEEYEGLCVWMCVWLWVCVSVCQCACGCVCVQERQGHAFKQSEAGAGTDRKREVVRPSLEAPPFVCHRKRKLTETILWIEMNDPFGLTGERGGVGCMVAYGHKTFMYTFIHTCTLSWTLQTDIHIDSVHTYKHIPKMHMPAHTRTQTHIHMIANQPSSTTILEGKNTRIEYHCLCINSKQQQIHAMTRKTTTIARTQPQWRQHFVDPHRCT